MMLKLRFCFSIFHSPIFVETENEKGKDRREKNQLVRYDFRSDAENEFNEIESVYFEYLNTCKKRRAKMSNKNKFN